jgi:hypothetical protein
MFARKIAALREQRKAVKETARAQALLVKRLHTSENVGVDELRRSLVDDLADYCFAMGTVDLSSARVPLISFTRRMNDLMGDVFQPGVRAKLISREQRQAVVDFVKEALGVEIEFGWRDVSIGENTTIRVACIYNVIASPSLDLFREQFLLFRSVIDRLSDELQTRESVAFHVRDGRSWECIVRALQRHGFVAEWVDVASPEGPELEVRLAPAKKQRTQ